MATILLRVAPYLTNIINDVHIACAFECGHFVIFSCECFCNPCEYMRSLSARWESQKSADAESPFLCLTFPCLQHFASRTRTKILAQVVKLPALTLFLPLHYHSHSLFHSSQVKSLGLQPTNVVSQSCCTKQETRTPNVPAK